MAQFVDNNASFKIAITVGGGSVPKIHTAASLLTVRRCHEVRVVVSAAVLGVGNNCIIALATAAEVFLLEVTGDLVESVTIVQVVNEVDRVKELSYGCVNVLLRFFQLIRTVGLWIVREVEVQAWASIWSVVVLPIVTTFPVLMRKDLRMSSEIIYRSKDFPLKNLHCFPK